jgi:hypothetical protein
MNWKINFLDNEDNTIYSRIKEFDSEEEAAKYAKLILATTSDNCVTFEIWEA